MGRVLVYFPQGLEEEPYGVLAQALLPLEGSGDAGSQNGDGEDAESRIELFGPEDGLEGEERDVLIAPAPGGTAPATVVAADPYLFTLDQRAGVSPLEGGGGNLRDFEGWLGTLNRDKWLPLAVAGEEKLDFAAFVLYFARELLPSESFAILLNQLGMGTGPRPAAGWTNDDAERVEAMVQRLEPVINTLNGWKEQGLLAINWTNWDRIAVENAQINGRAAATFQRRSEVRSLDWEGSFHLRLRLPPVGPERRVYGLLGRAVSVTGGEGPRADAAGEAREVLLNQATQNAIEAESSWSPVRLEGAATNSEHRDVVRWIRGAEPFLLLDERVAEHPLLRRVHQLLR